MGGRVGSITTDIIADGLVFNMDAVNRASYVPNATTSYNTIDLSQSGTFYNGVAFIQPPISSSCWDFDGTDDYTQAALDGTSTGGILAASDSDVAVSISFWFKVNNISSAEGIWQWANQLTDPTPFILFRTSSGPDRVRFYIDGAYQSLQAINLSQWYHVVLTRTAADNTWRGYLNGDSTPWFTKDDGGAISARSSATDIYFGNGYNGYAPCSIANFQIYNRTLSANEVLHNYNALKGRFGL